MTVLTKDQKQKRTKVYTENGTTYRATVEIRHDDECRNGHNTFSITVDQYRKANPDPAAPGRWAEDSFGCQHDLAVKLWPDLAPFIRWHLMSTDGPLHYPANALYLAGDKDCHGKRKGEPLAYDIVIYVGNSPIAQKPGREAFRKWLMAKYEKGTRFFPIAQVAHAPDCSRDWEPKYTFVGYKGENIKWQDCPFDTLLEASEWNKALEIGLTFEKIPTRFSEGKEPELELARRAAIWPDATLEQLQDKAALEARLPKLLEEFQRDVESLGFVY